MLRYFLPISIASTIFTLGSLILFLFVPPINGWLVAIFLIIFGLSLAGWASLGIYYLRRFWGPKDSPRYLLRDSIRQALIGSVGVMVFLFLQLLGAINLLTLIILLGLVVTFERLT
jgi:hypothetical protein